MNYTEIIRDNCFNHSPVTWWPRYAFHYTDITNAVSILNTSMLFSRAKAEAMGVMRNDNASRQVIDMTKTEAISCVRFYFRPLTPTQYYNEGFKHPQLRYCDDQNANTPVPIFFLFDLEKLLSKPGVKFSDQKQAGNGSTLKSGVDSFATLNFDNVYSNKLENIVDTKSFRHAEILHPNSMCIDDCLETILCRNSIERISLLNMLKGINSFAFQKYQGIIKVGKRDVFEKNGLFVTDCTYGGNTVGITFSDPYARKNYTASMKRKNGVDELNLITVKLVLDWFNSRNHLYHTELETMIDYEKTPGLVYRSVPQVQNSKFLRIQLFLEEKLMCFVEYPIADSELIK